MQHVGKVVSLPVNPSTTSLSAALESLALTRQDRIPEATMAELFLMFRSVWGARWDDAVMTSGLDTALAQWSQGLAGLSIGDMAQRFAWCRENLTWSPTIAEFRAAGSVRCPKGRAEWAAWGQSIGKEPRPGEEWDDYIGRLSALWEKAK